MSTIQIDCNSKNQYLVHIVDPTTSGLRSMMDFIEEADLSFVSVEELDVSDLSIYYDIIHVYTFAKEEDALIFTLKFKGTAGNG